MRDPDPLFEALAERLRRNEKPGYCPPMWTYLLCALFWIALWWWFS